MRVCMSFLGIIMAWISICAPAGRAQDQPIGAAGEDFRPVAEDLLPLRNRVVSLELRDTHLRDALYSIAESVGLNLVLENGVNPDMPLTLSIKNTRAEDAINIILDAAGYFYRLQDNIIFVKHTDTRIFEFGQPAVVQSYSVSVGGDILGAAVEGARSFSENSGGGGGSGSSSGGSGGDMEMKGKVEQQITSDAQAFDFWNSIERALASILGIEQNAQQTGAALTNQPSCTINRMTGTIAVTATRQGLERVEQFIETVRQALSRQVIIEARIMEVRLSKGNKYGIDWSWLPSDSVTIRGNNFSNVISPTSPNISVHISRGDFTGMLRAIESQGHIRVLSNPRVNIMNGQTALLSVGRSQTYLSAVESDVSTGDNPVITYTTQTSSVLSGIMIGIVPYINAQGMVTMTITPIISELISLEEKAIGQEGTMISLPTVDLRQLSTSVKVADGEMIVIGGLVQTKRKTDDNKVPFIGKLPLIGYLFTRFDNTDEQTDIVILLKPTAML